LQVLSSSMRMPCIVRMRERFRALEALLRADDGAVNETRGISPLLGIRWPVLNRVACNSTASFRSAGSGSNAYLKMPTRALRECGSKCGSKGRKILGRALHLL
jgi:hypothetical protein